MVLINAGNRMPLKRRTSNKYRNNNPKQLYTKYGLLACAGVTVASLLYTVVWITRTHATKRAIRRSDQAQQFNRNHHHKIDQNHPELGLAAEKEGENADLLDAMASDILITLQCHQLLGNKGVEFVSTFGNIYGGLPLWDDKKERRRRRRRLEEERDFFADQDAAGAKRAGMDDDDLFDPNVVSGYKSGAVTAAHLFCLAAFPPSQGIPEDMDETVWWADKVSCGVRTSTDIQRKLLDLWSTARAELTDTLTFKKLLQVTTEHTISLFGKTLNVWAASNDQGTEYLVNSFKSVYDKHQKKHQGNKNNDNDNDNDNDQGDESDNNDNDLNEYEAIMELGENLGEGKLFVDVGSGLGYTAMAIAILYPGTQIVSIEAATTNWLLQEINWLCNDFEGIQEDVNPPHVVLAGIGPSAGTSQAAHFVWRPTETTNTRAWSLNLEKDKAEADAVNADTEHHTDSAVSRYDLQLNVKLRPWHMVQAEAEMANREIAVLNVDCEGCEYNLIPALSETVFGSISTVLGQMHWSYIPTLQKPSSKRAADTHKRLCQHEDFARTAMECCAFPELPVKSRQSGEILVVDGTFPEKPATVKYLAGKLCDGFEAWADKHDLYNVESDWGWFQGGTRRQMP